MTSKTKIVKRRAVFFIGGFDPKSPEQFYSRMDRENGRFQTLWDARVERDELPTDSPDIACSRFTASGEAMQQNWATQTDFHYLSVDDIVLKDFSRPILVRLYHYLIAFFDYLFSGTAFKFIRHSWRFAIYFFYPPFMLILAALISWGFASQISRLSLPYPDLATFAVFLVLLCIIYLLMLKPYRVFHLMDLWSFSRQYLHQRTPDMDDKLNRLADVIYEMAASNEIDEILTIGHSTGGALILDATARANERHEGYASVASKVTVLTVGSTSLKIGLHPSSGWYRHRLANLFSSTDTRWMEFQCLTDVINFYRTDPSQLMGFKERMKRHMEIYSIRIKYMISADVYKRIKGNHFRVHYQFVYGNTEKNLYDFPAICFGPVTLQSRMQTWTDSTQINPFFDNLLGIGKGQND